MHTLVGVFLGIMLLHPVTMVIYCMEFHPELAQSDIARLVASRMTNAFSPSMWQMTGTFAFIGALLGLGSGLYSRANTRKMLLVSHLDQKLGKGIQSLIATGESAVVEFKSSLRWDHVQRKRNKALELVIVKTIAGFLNHDGGDLLIGVAVCAGRTSRDSKYRCPLWRSRRRLLRRSMSPTRKSNFLNS